MKLIESESHEYTYTCQLAVSVLLIELQRAPVEAAGDLSTKNKCPGSSVLHPKHSSSPQRGRIVFKGTAKLEALKEKTNYTPL